MLMIYTILPVTIIGISILLATMHMVAPDHWTPILSYSARNRLDRRKTGIISLSLGLIHGIFSAIISFLIVIIGITFFPEFYIKILTVGILASVAIYIFLNANLEERKNSDKTVNRSILLVSIIPDPAIVPIILIATIYGMQFVYVTLLLFVIASATALLCVTLLLSKYLITRIKTFTPKKIDYMVSLILIGTMLFVLL